MRQWILASLLAVAAFAVSSVVAVAGPPSKGSPAQGTVTFRTAMPTVAHYGHDTEFYGVINSRDSNGYSLQCCTWTPFSMVVPVQIEGGTSNANAGFHIECFVGRSGEPTFTKGVFVNPSFQDWYLLGDFVELPTLRTDANGHFAGNVLFDFWLYPTEASHGQTPPPYTWACFPQGAFRPSPGNTMSGATLYVTGTATPSLDATRHWFYPQVVAPPLRYGVH